MESDMIYTGSYYPSSVRMRDLSDQLEPRREFQSIQPRPGLIPSAAPVRSHPSSYSFGPPNDPGPYRGFSSPSAQDHLSGYSQPSPVYPDHAKNYQAAQLPPLDASQVPNWQYPYPAHYSQQDTCSLSESRPGAYERVAGKPSYPPIAPSRGPKQRFTQEDDDLLKKLKEDYISPRLSWKQIADFFPDRNSGTLQVRYCTKLKKKDEIRWTEESDRKLIKLLKEDEDSRWKRIANKMGNGATDMACEARAEEMNAHRLRAQGYDDGD